jgi:hypothetical protein
VRHPVNVSDRAAIPASTAEVFSPVAGPVRPPARALVVMDEESGTPSCRSRPHEGVFDPRISIKSALTRHYNTGNSH